MINWATKRSVTGREFPLGRFIATRYALLLLEGLEGRVQATFLLLLGHSAFS